MELVKAVTSDHELFELADRLGVHLDDILEVEEASREKLKSGSFIVLLGSGRGVGHWVASHDGEWFDSTGIGPPERLGPMKYNQKQYQGTYDEFCGPWCLLWLYSKQKNRMDLMEGFNNLDVDFV